MGRPSSKTAACSCSSAGRKVSKERMSGQSGDSCSRAMMREDCCGWLEGLSSDESLDFEKQVLVRMGEQGKALVPQTTLQCSGSDEEHLEMPFEEHSGMPRMSHC